MARRRSLRPEEQELWHAVARTARPMHQPNIFLKPLSAPLHPVPIEAHKAPAAATPQPRLPHFRLGEKVRTLPVLDLARSPGAALAVAGVQMDAKTHTKMLRGRLSPDARLDLHGMTLAEAHPELIRFVLNAQSWGSRLVLVITGKGKLGQDFGIIPQRLGALRHQVPQWLRMPPLGAAVLQVAEAHLRHGGSGAYYVYLRRGR